MDASLQRLVRYLQEVSATGVSPAAQHAAQQRLIDSVGCAAAAFAQSFCQQMRQLGAAYTHRHYSARIWGSGQYTTREMAALVNGTMLRYLDLSDTVLSRSNGHPSDMLGALVAVAEAHRCTGTALLQAIVASYEVYVSLCDAVAMASKGVDQSTAAAVGAAAGVALLLQLDAAQTGHALALALCSHVHLYNVRCGALSDWKGAAGPHGAQHGVFAALLAQAGVSGPSASIDGKGGLQTVLGAFDWQLGEGPARIVHTHLKLHPVCYHGQAAVDAALALRRQVPADQVQQVRITTYDAAWQGMGSETQHWHPCNRETADHSLPYVVATAWLDGALTAQSYAPAQLARADRLAWMQRITVHSCAQMTEAFPAQAQARIEVTDVHGRTHVHLQPNPRGHARQPLSDAELLAKFAHSAPLWGDAAQVQHLLDTLWRLPDLDDVSVLVDLLVAAPGTLAAQDGAHEASVHLAAAAHAVT